MVSTRLVTQVALVVTVLLFLAVIFLAADQVRASAAPPCPSRHYACPPVMHPADPQRKVGWRHPTEGRYFSSIPLVMTTTCLSCLAPPQMPSSGGAVEDRFGQPDNIDGGAGGARGAGGAGGGGGAPATGMSVAGAASPTRVGNRLVMKRLPDLLVALPSCPPALIRGFLQMQTCSGSPTGS